MNNLKIWSKKILTEAKMADQKLANCDDKDAKHPKLEDDAKCRSTMKRLWEGEKLHLLHMNQGTLHPRWKK